jgi:hypothetical protein
MMKNIALSVILACSVNASIADEPHENCFGPTEITTELDFFNSDLTEDSLHEGGTLKYEGIGFAGDRAIDLVVSVVPGTTYSSIKAEEKNGLNGEFGSINLYTEMNDYDSGEGNFRFCFHDHESGDVTTVDSFLWSVYDVDERGEGHVDGIKEKMIMDLSQTKGYSLYPDVENSELVISCEDESDPPCVEGVRTVFHSSVGGGGGDNPDDPNDLDDLQKKRSIVFSFDNVSCWDFTYNHYCRIEEETDGDTKCTWYGGGNFLFAGEAKGVVEEGECVISTTDSPTKSPTESPTKAPTESPTVAPTKAPTDQPTVAGEESSCLGDKQMGTELDFFNSELTEETLHEGGTLKYENIGVIRDRPVDLVVSVVPDTDYFSEKGSEKNGKNGNFGNINLYTIEGDIDSGKGSFRFCFHDHETGDIATADSFLWSVYDLDERGDSGIVEKMIMDASQASDYFLYPNMEESEIDVSCEYSGSPPPCEQGERLVFHSSTGGTGDDNPEDPNDLDEQQKKRSVVFAFQDVSCWDFTYNHYCAIEAESEGETKCNNYTGGNFLFAGNAKGVVEGGECLTPSPTVAPNPTEEPTPDWQRFGEPTPDIKFPEPDCPNDVRVLKTNGSTEFPDSNNAVSIVSKDTETVTVSLNQVWDTESIDSIFYEYNPNDFDTKCYEEDDVTVGSTYTDEITIQCLHMTPVAKLRICLADSVEKEFLTFKDEAEISKCCHSEGVPADKPVVCYTLEINCKPGCPEDHTQEAARSLRGAKYGVE